MASYNQRQIEMTTRAAVALAAMVMATGGAAGMVQPELEALATEDLPTPVSSGGDSYMVNRAAQGDYFEPNRGQWHDDVLFAAMSNGYTLFLTYTEAVFVLGSGDRSASHAIRFAYEGAAPAPQASGKGELAAYSNYFLGNDPSRWASHVPRFSEVIQHEVWPGIDLRWYHEPGWGVKFDAIVAPGATPDAIRFHTEGAESLSIDDRGRLVMDHMMGHLVKDVPHSYQILDDDRRTPVQNQYWIGPDMTFGFKPGVHDPERVLVIDPLVLHFSTYLGGSDGDGGKSIAVDSQGYTYVTGETRSTDFPVDGIQIVHGGHEDAFVTKFTPDGDVVFSTYLGGAEQDLPKGIDVSPGAQIYITGQTNSPDFPLKDAYQDHCAGVCAFVTKFSPSGNPLAYSTYLGGWAGDNGMDIAVDDDGNALVVGRTWANDFPIANAVQPTFGGNIDAFVTKLAPDGQSLVYSTYLGGSGWDSGWGVATDSAGAAYVTGTTGSSPDFPLSNALQGISGGDADLFIAKLTSSGSFVYSTFFGGSGSEYAGHSGAIAADDAGNAFVAGGTCSIDFPLRNAIQDQLADTCDTLMLKLSPTGTTLLFSSYLGGSEWDHGLSVDTDSAGHAYFTGETQSPDFPLRNQLDLDQQTSKRYLLKLHAETTHLMYSTYLGGTGGESFAAVAASADGVAHVTGSTASDDFPLVDAYQSVRSGGTDAFVTKVLPNQLAAPSAIAVSPGPGLGELAITWEPPSDDGGYDIVAYRLYGGDTADALAFLTETTALSFAESGLADGKDRFYAVSAVNTQGEGPRSDTASGTTFDVPSEPLNLLAEMGTAPGEIDLSWSPPADDHGSPVTEYRVYRGEAPDSLTLLATGLEAIGFTDTGLPNGAFRYYQVTAGNAIGEGPGTTIEGAAAPDVPAQVLDLVAATGTAVGEIDLSWVVPDNGGLSISGYRIYRGTAPGSLSLLTEIDPGSSWTDEDLPRGALRYYSVSATNAAGEGEGSAEAFATAPDVPAAPVNPVTTRGPDGGQITVDWILNADDGGLPVAQNAVYSANTPDGSFSKIATIEVTTAFVDQGLPNGATRCYKIASINAAGEGPPSATACGQAPDVPSAPLAIDAAPPPVSFSSSEGLVGPGDILVTWEHPADANGMPVTGYLIHRTSVEGGETVRIAHSSTETEWLDDDRIPGARYYYTVSAINGVGESPTGQWDSARAGTYPSDGDGDLMAEPVEENICATGLLRTVWELTPGLTGHPLLGHCDEYDLQTLSGLDADGDLMPDAVEPFMCAFIDNAANPDDGICVGEDWGPPPG